MGLTMRSINYKRDDAYFPYMRYLLIHDRIPNNHLLYKYIFLILIQICAPQICYWDYYCLFNIIFIM